MGVASDYVFFRKVGLDYVDVTAGGGVTPGGTATPSTPPTLTAPAPPRTTTPLYGGGGLTPGMGPEVPTTQNSKASSEFSIAAILVPLSLLLAPPFILQPM
ncbi:unnamed protein product [Ilex paraguariensis]|uniref:Uncharacterized protein n=1 Tax=Ilex paraguariensis TaxID=185542 RepID=A0ABC8RJK0_9AQUA